MIRSLALCAGLLTAASFPRPVWASSTAVAPASSEVEAVLEVDATELGEEGEVLEAQIADEGTRILEREGVVEPAGPGEAAAIRITIKWIDRENFHYSISIDVEPVGKPVQAGARTFECRTCTENKLIERCIDELTEVVPLIKEKPDDENGKPTPPSNGNGTPPDNGKKKPKIGPLGGAGIGAMALGAIGIGVGVGLAVRDDKIVGDQGNIEVKSTQTPGWALVGVGAGLLVTGTALLVVDLVRRKRDRKVSVAPMLAPSVAGLTASLKF